MGGFGLAGCPIFAGLAGHINAGGLGVGRPDEMGGDGCSGVFVGSCVHGICFCGVG